MYKVQSYMRGIDEHFEHNRRNLQEVFSCLKNKVRDVAKSWYNKFLLLNSYIPCEQEEVM